MLQSHAFWSKKCQGNLPKNYGDVIGRLNYISRFISQMTAKCDPIFKLLKKHDSEKWIEECQIAFDKVKDYLSTPPILVPPIPRKPLILYLTICRRQILSGLLCLFLFWVLGPFVARFEFGPQTYFVVLFIYFIDSLSHFVFKLLLVLIFCD